MGVRAAGPVTFEVGFDAPRDVRDGLATIGRTEDVRIAPGGRRLAIAAFAANAIALAEVEIARFPTGPEIAVTSLDLFPSDALYQPHGLDFLDDDTLIVANRGAGISVFRLPASGGSREGALMELVGEAEAPLLDAPGSVAVHSRAPGHYDVLVCNNSGHTVTRHRLSASGALVDGEVVARKWLDIPDGLALSHDERWLAVSNHDAHAVFVYGRSELGEGAEPVGILRGLQYPHGVRFGGGDRYVVVADAGAPHVHAFLPSGNGWEDVGYPAATITVMDDETFLRARHNAQEGGPKGIDVDPRTNVLAVTTEAQPLAFFDVEAALGERERGRADTLVRCELDVLGEKAAAKEAAAEELATRHAQLESAWAAHAAERAERERLTMELERLGAEMGRLGAEMERLTAERERISAQHQQLAAALAEANSHLDRVHNSSSWRLTAPMRNVFEVARRLKQRSR